jgi:hypothetical protein
VPLHAADPRRHTHGRLGCGQRGHEPNVKRGRDANRSAGAPCLAKSAVEFIDNTEAFVEEGGNEPAMHHGFEARCAITQSKERSDSQDRAGRVGQVRGFGGAEERKDMSKRRPLSAGTVMIAHATGGGCVAMRVREGVSDELVMPRANGAKALRDESDRFAIAR